LTVQSSDSAEQRPERVYRDVFLAMFHGRGPYRVSRGGISGDTGRSFLVIARSTRSLQELQTICMEAERTISSGPESRTDGSNPPTAALSEVSGRQRPAR
jgi:hypothetical protein